MKSSTLRRSNLSKENMRLLEELSRNKKRPSSPAPEVYVRPNKEKELDVLWQNFRVNQKDEKSPGIYLVTGFIAGAIAMLIVTTLLSFTFNSEPNDLGTVEPVKEKAKLTFIPADKSMKNVSSDKQGKMAPGTGSGESYVVKQGDTLAGIVVRFYGKYDVSKIEKIKQVNGLANENSLKMGQSLIIPMD